MLCWVQKTQLSLGVLQVAGAQQYLLLAMILLQPLAGVGLEATLMQLAEVVEFLLE